LVNKKPAAVAEKPKNEEQPKDQTNKSLIIGAGLVLAAAAIAVLKTNKAE